MCKPLKGKFLSEFSTFGIGGPAKLFLSVRSIEEMSQALHFAHMHKLSFLILGKGSNCLFDDKGFDGLVIQNKIEGCHFDQNRVSVGAGYSFALLGVQTARKGFEGLEFASGIPGTVGGAIFMNAGANGKDTSESIEEVIFVHASGKVEKFPKEKLQFSYRSSTFQKLKGAIVQATFLLHFEPTARKKQIEIVQYRTKTQPYGKKSAGCIFRNPKEESAGYLIEKCGLKGMSSGGAKVSELHGNFIINDDHATAKDVLNLIKKVKNEVFRQTNISLEMEVRYIPNLEE